MKAKNKKVKLTIEKLKVSKLKTPGAIIGGNGGDDGQKSVLVVCKPVIKR